MSGTGRKTNLEDLDLEVPSQDSADNVTVSDVVGNKTDTTGGDSLVALNKINAGKLDTIDGFHDVPSQDSAANSQMRDVVGNKTDTHNGNSVRGILNLLKEHSHGISRVYPHLANGVTLTASGSSWVLGSITEIVPVNTITSDFDIHWLNAFNISANGQYQICIYQGGAGSEALIAEIDVERTAVQSQEGSQPVITPLIAANARISAAIASSNAAANTVDVKVRYHEY